MVVLLSNERMELQLDKDFKLPVYQERHYFAENQLRSAWHGRLSFNFSLHVPRFTTADDCSWLFKNNNEENIQEATLTTGNSSKTEEFFAEFTNITYHSRSCQSNERFLQASHIDDFTRKRRTVFSVVRRGAARAS